MKHAPCTHTHAHTHARNSLEGRRRGRGGGRSELAALPFGGQSMPTVGSVMCSVKGGGKQDLFYTICTLCMCGDVYREHVRATE